MAWVRRRARIAFEGRVQGGEGIGGKAGSPFGLGQGGAHPECAPLSPQMENKARERYNQAN